MRRYTVADPQCFKTPSGPSVAERLRASGKEHRPVILAGLVRRR
jgi:hypothetical protein